jgi:hypothetical protein
MSKKRYEKAHEILKKVAHENRRELNENLWAACLKEV